MTQIKTKYRDICSQLKTTSELLTAFLAQCHILLQSQQPH